VYAVGAFGCCGSYCVLRSPSFPGRMADLCCTDSAVLQQGGTVCMLSCADTTRPARVRVYGQGHGTMLHRTGRTLPHAPSARVQSLLPAPHAPLRRTRSKLSRSASVDASHAMQMMGVLLSTLIHRCWRTISECIIPCLVPAVQSLRQLVCRLSLGLVFSRQAAGSGRPGMPARVRVWADWPMSSF
jgi:hypothetical protein